MSKTLEKITPGKSPATPVEQDRSPVKEEVAAPTHKALALYRDPTDTKYVLVEVSFTPGDSTVKELTRDNREDTTDKFKMYAADYFMGDR